MIVLKRTLAWYEPAQDFDFFFFCWNVWRIDCSFSATYKPSVPYFLRSSAQIQADLGKMIFHIINFPNFVQLWFQNIQSNIKCQIDTDTVLLRKIFHSSLFLFTLSSYLSFQTSSYPSLGKHDLQIRTQVHLIYLITNECCGKMYHLNILFLTFNVITL